MTITTSGKNMKSRILLILVWFFMAAPLMAQPYSWSPTTHQVISGDFNGDGRTDLLVQALDDSSNTFISFSFQESGQRIMDFLLDPDTLSIGLSASQSRLLAADVNGDGSDDVLVLHQDEEQIHVLLTQTTRLISNQGSNFDVRKHDEFDLDHLMHDSRLRDYAVHLGDLNGDNKTDLVLQPKISGNQAFAVLSDTSAKFNRKGVRELQFGIDLTANNQVLHIADFNGDFRDDLLVQQIQSNSEAHQLVLIEENIEHSQSISIDDDALGLVWHADTTEISLADFDQNGLTDLVLVREHNLDPNYTGLQIELAYLKNHGQQDGRSSLPTFQRCAFGDPESIQQQNLIPCIDVPDQIDNGTGQGQSNLGKGVANQPGNTRLGIATQASSGIVDASPNTCEVDQTQSHCATLIHAERTDGSSVSGARYPSCLFLQSSPSVALVCGNLIDIPMNIAQPGETFVYRLNSFPFSQVLDQTTVTVTEEQAQIPPPPSAFVFNGVEGLSFFPPIDIGGQFYFCYQMPRLEPGLILPTRFEYQYRNASAGESWPMNDDDVIVIPANFDPLFPVCELIEQTPDPDLTITYEYRHRNCNNDGCSTYGQASPISIRSEEIPELGGLSLSGIESVFPRGTPPIDHPFDYNGEFQVSWDSNSATDYFVRYFSAFGNSETEVYEFGPFTNIPDDGVSITIPTQSTRQQGTLTVTECAISIGSSCPDSHIISSVSTLMYIRENAPPENIQTITALGFEVTISEFVDTNIDTDGTFAFLWSAQQWETSEWEVRYASSSTVLSNGAGINEVANLTEEEELRSDTIQDYLFRVRTTNLLGISDWIETPLRVLPEAPEPPTNITASPNPSLNGIYTLSWSPPTTGNTPTEYRIFERAGLGWVGVPRSQPESLSETFIGKPIGTYHYHILACIDLNCSDVEPDADTRIDASVSVGVPLGNSPIEVTEADFSWDNEPSGIFSLSWSYSEEAFHTQNGRPTFFKITAPFECLLETNNCLQATVAVDPQQDWQSRWTKFGLINSDALGSIYEIEACNQNTCSPAVPVSLTHSSGTALIGVNPPEWTNPSPPTNGHNAEDSFTLSWNNVDHPDISYYEIIEERYNLHADENLVGLGNLTHYIEGTEFKLIRTIPASYRFEIRACQVIRPGTDQCTGWSEYPTPGSDEFVVNDNHAPVSIPADISDSMLFSATLNPDTGILFGEFAAADSDFNSLLTAPDAVVITVAPMPGASCTGRVDSVHRLNGYNPNGWEYQLEIPDNFLQPDCDVQYIIKACKNNGKCNSGLNTFEPDINSNAAPLAPVNHRSNVPGGPDDLKPGEWFDPEFPGTGWSFYWASELRYPSIHELYGDTYDLLAFWFTYRKLNDGETWEPVWMFSLLKHDDISPNSFKGTLYYPQKDIVSGGYNHIDAGSVEVIYEDPASGGDNTHVMVRADVANLGGMVDTYEHNLQHLAEDEVLHGPLGDVECSNFDQREHNPADFYRGLWWNLGADGTSGQVDQDLLALTFIERNFESLIVPFYDTAGQPAWARTEFGSSDNCDADNPVATLTPPTPADPPIVLNYIVEGFDPSEPAPDGYSLSDNYVGVGWAARQFETSTGQFDPKYRFSITLPSNTGREAPPQYAETPLMSMHKAASFHDIRFFVQGQNEFVTECEINTGAFCDIELTWFTDDLYPDLKAYHCGPNAFNHINLRNVLEVESSCSEITLPVSVEGFPSVIKHSYEGVSQPGPHAFVLHNGRPRNQAPFGAAIIAQSATLTVEAADEPNSTLAIIPDADLNASTLHPRPIHDPTIGAVGGQGGVSGGSATYSIPFVIPPGRQGMQPNVGLSYSSRAGNGHVGMGWSLSGTSSIHRCPQTEAQDTFSIGVTFTNSDRLCLDGQRLIKINDAGDDDDGNYWNQNSEYRTEIDSFVRVVKTSSGDATSPNQSFTVQGKDQLTRIYNFDTRAYRDNDSQASSWRIAEQQDPSGNSVHYHYSQGAPNSNNNLGIGEVVLDYITYTGYGADKGNRRIDFNYGERCDDNNQCDISESYLSGYLNQQTVRLETVTACINADVNTDCVNTSAHKVREYNLTYHISHASNRQLLTSVQECAYQEDNNNNKDCRGGTDGGSLFFWNDAPIGFEQLVLQDGMLVDIDSAPPIVDVNQACAGISHELCLEHRLSPRTGWRAGGDYDGDGIREVWITSSTYDLDEPSRVNYQHYLAKLDAQGNVIGQFDATDLISQFIGRRGIRGTGDFDHDGRSDFLFNDNGALKVKRWKECIPGQPCVWSINQFEDLDTGITINSEDLIFLEPGYGALQPRVLTTDINADGLIDIVITNPTANIVEIYLAETNANAAIGHIWVQHASANFPIATVEFDIFNAGIEIYPEQVNGASDLDGDGRVELLIGSPYFSGVQYQGAVWSKVVRFTENANGILAYQIIELGNIPDGGFDALGLAHYTSNIYWQFADINGDGLQDFVYIDQPENSPSERPNWMVQMNTGRSLSDTSGYKLFTAPIDTQSNDGVYAPYSSLASPPPQFDRNRWRPRFGESLQVGDFDNDGKAEILYPASIQTRYCVSQNVDTTSPEPDVRLFCAHGPNEGRDGAGVGDAPIEDQPGLSSWDDSTYAYEYLNFDLSVDGNISISRSENSDIEGKRQVQIDDLFGDGYTDIFGRVGCRSPVTFCDFYDAQTNNNTDPESVKNLQINRGLLGGDTDNETVDPVPQPLDTIRMSSDDLGRKMFWDYKPLSFQNGSRGAPANTAPLYYVPEDRNEGYLEDQHFYFASSMYVVSSMDQSNGLSADGLATNRTYYSYGEAVFNTQGRGFQGFRTIVNQQAIGDGNDLRTTTRFNQFFPLAGTVEETYTQLASEPVDMAMSAGSNAIEQTVNSYEPGDRTNGTYFPYMSLQTATRRQLDPAIRTIVTESLINGVVYDIYGNMKEQTVTTRDFDEDGSLLLTHASMVENDYYDADIPAWWVNQLKSTVTESHRTYANTGQMAIGFSLPGGVNPQVQRSITQFVVWNAAHRKPACNFSIEGNHNTPVLCSTSIDHWSPNTQANSNTFTFDGYGNVLTTTINATDLDDSRVTITSYTNGDNLGYFVTSITNPLWHTLKAEVNARYGLTIETENPNSQIVRMNHDAFGQEIETYYPNTDSNITFDQTDNHYMPRSGGYVLQRTACGSIPNAAQASVNCLKTITDGAPPITALIDQFGRNLVTDTQGYLNNASQTIRSSQAFNRRGQQAASTRPYYLSESSYTSNYHYDALNRMVLKIQPRETAAINAIAPLETLYIHEGLQTTIWVSHAGAAAGQCTGSSMAFLADRLCVSRTHDSSGGLLTTSDAHGQRTRFWADAIGSPVLIEDPQQNLTAANYNNFGQRTDLFDPNMGHWSFDYNGLGELLSQQDANGQLQTFDYDELGRLERQQAFNSTSASAWMITDEWIYDEGNKRGLLTRENRLTDNNTGPVYSRQYYYDQHNRPIGYNTDIQGRGSFEVNNTVDQYFARPKSVSWPETNNGASLHVYQKYDINGYLIEEGETADYLNSPFLRKIESIGPAGAIRRVEYGNGVIEQSQYYESTGQVSSVCASAAGANSCNGSASDFMVFAYQYDRFGNLVSQSSQPNQSNQSIGSDESFRYDRLHRLLESTREYNGMDAPASQVTSYAYDSLGNISNKGDYASNYVYGNGAGPNAVTSIQVNSGGQSLFQYDENGNLVQRHRDNLNGILEMDIDYDIYNKPVSIQRNGIDLQFEYGSNQQRYSQIRVDLGIETVYIDKLYERRAALSEHKYYLSDWGVWTVGGNDAGMKYLHRDRLGSVSVITNAAGQLEDDASRGFDPFGKPREGDWQDSTNSNIDLNRADLTTRGFTQHEHLNSVELIHMNGRTYDYNLGRFLSADPFVQFPTNSQSLNRYSYLMNNPLGGTDPTGYMGKWITVWDRDSCKSKCDLELTNTLRTLGFQVFNGNVIIPSSGIINDKSGISNIGTFSDRLDAQPNIGELNWPGIGNEIRRDGVKAVERITELLNDSEFNSFDNADDLLQMWGDFLWNFDSGVMYGTQAVGHAGDVAFGSLTIKIMQESFETAMKKASSQLNTIEQVRKRMSILIDSIYGKKLKDLPFTKYDIRLSDIMNSKDWTRHLKSIRKKGIEKKTILYVMLDGKPTIVLGNNRFRAARKLNMLDELRFKETTPPVKNTQFHTLDDVRDGMDRTELSPVPKDFGRK